MQQRRGWPGALVSLVLVLALVACTDDGSGAAQGEDQDPGDTTTTTVVWPDQDRSIDIEGGSVLFHQWDDDSSRQLAMVPSTGGATSEVTVDGLGGVMGATVAPDGQTVAALGWDPTVRERNTTVLIGGVGGGFEALHTDGDLLFRCVRWFPDGERVLVTAFDEEAPDPYLLEIDLHGEVTELRVPTGRYECAVPLADGRIVLTYAGEGTSLVAMALVRPSSDEVEVLYSKVGCLLYGPSPSWTGDELVVAASCEEPADSGLHIVDVATGEVEQILEGELSYPSFSPSGDWITFGLFPNPDALKSTIWAVRRDGSGLRRLSDVVGAQPAWVADSPRSS